MARGKAMKGGGAKFKGGSGKLEATANQMRGDSRRGTAKSAAKAKRGK